MSEMAGKSIEPRYAELIEQVGSDGVDWDDFRIFLEVIRQGSFNKAAAKLNMTQPTVSRRLLRLEKAVGTRLFERDRRGPRLTFEGQRVYTDASVAQVALTRAATDAASGVERERGDCKVLMGDALATYWMSRFVGPFFTRYPNIELKLVGTNDPSPERRESCDLHVHYFEPAEADRGTVRLAMLHYLPFASRGYLDRFGTPASTDDLAKHRLLDQAAHLSDVSKWAHWSKPGRTVRNSFFTNLSGSLGEAVRYGAGIALMPTYAAAVDEGYVPLEIGLRFQTPISMSINRSAKQDWPTRAVFDFLCTTVFDRENMPWFAADYIPPEPDWPDRARQLAAAADIAAPDMPGDEGHR